MRRLFAAQAPGMKQVEVTVIVGNIVGVRQARHRILGGKAGNVEGRAHRLLDRGG